MMAQLRLACVFLLTALAQAAGPWDIKALSNPPKVFDGTATEPGVRALFYESVPWKGKPTRVFAYYGAPQGKNLPAMVLIHGGGGTAFAEWVRQWNQRGYAAIAMDTCGARPETAPADKPWNPVKNHHDNGGPPGWGGFDQIDQPSSDQWAYHAVAAAVLAHSLIRSFPEIDPKRIGVTGISWGGYLTNIVAGVDPRFRFAAPVYGCGFLGENSAWLDNFQKMGKERADKWLGLWDPSVYLPGAKMPILWVTGTNDFAYPPDSLQKSYRLPHAERTLAVRVRMKHSHPDGAAPEEIPAFADAMFKGAPAFARVTRSSGGTVEYKSRRKIVKAELNYTVDRGRWQDRKWLILPASLNERSRTVKADIPPEATVWYINLFDERGLVVSSEHEYRDAAAASPRPGS
jgi:dienelactone hydrolase